MKKIFKKSLAIMVSAAICLTALIGCLSVSAATRGEGTFTVGSDSGKPGELVTVPIELTYTSSNGEDGMGIAASLFDVSFDTDALTITDIAAGEDATRDPGSGGLPGGEDVPPQDIYTVEYRSTDGETISVVDDAVRILAMPADNETVLTSMTVNLTFTINEGAAAQDYAITITEQQTCDYGQATPDELGNFTYADDEEFIEMSVTNGKVTVVEDVIPTEPVEGTLGVNWNSTNPALVAYHYFDADNFMYSKDYLILTDNYNAISAATDVSYKFIVKGNGFCVEWGDEGLLERTGYATLSNLSIANIAYDITWQLVIEYTSQDGVRHIDRSEPYIAVSTTKISEIQNEKSNALLELVNTWKTNDTKGFVEVNESSPAKTFDMTADTTGTVDMNWSSTNDILMQNHYVTVSDFKYSKDYLIRTDYYNSLADATDVVSGFIVSGNGFSVQWESEGLIARTGFATISNLSILNLSSDITWKMYIKYTDAEGITHIDYTETVTNYITKINDNGYGPDENMDVVNAFKTFYSVWSAE